MALQDILAAITAEADVRIADARAEHQRALTSMREESERKIAKKKQEIAVSKKERMDQLQSKALAHAHAYKRNALLSKKKEILDRVFTKATVQLSQIDENEAEALLRACVRRIQSKGAIRPSEKHAALLQKICPSEQFRLEKTISAQGGFLFVSEKEEQDFTFEYLMENIIRPRSELPVAKSLFV